MSNRLKTAINGLNVLQSILAIPSTIAVLLTIAMGLWGKFDHLPASVIFIQCFCFFVVFLAGWILFLDLKDRLSTDNSNFGKFRSFLVRKVAEGNQLLDRGDIDIDTINAWHRKTVQGIKTALGEEIQNKDLLAALAVMETRIIGQKFYPNSMSAEQLKENLRQCIAQIKYIKIMVKRHMLLQQFDPFDLKEHE